MDSIFLFNLELKDKPTSLKLNSPQGFYSISHRKNVKESIIPELQNQVIKPSYALLH